MYIMCALILVLYTRLTPYLSMPSLLSLPPSPLSPFSHFRCNGKVGYSPAALIRRIIAPQSSTPATDACESEKSIYEELNIHRPPPRLSSISASKINRPYDNPRTNPVLAKLVGGGKSDYVDPASDSEPDTEEYYHVPKPSLLPSSSIESSAMVNGHTSVRSANSTSRETSPLSPTSSQQPPLMKFASEHPSNTTRAHHTSSSSVTDGNSHRGDGVEESRISAIYDAVPEEYGYTGNEGIDYENMRFGASAELCDSLISAASSTVSAPSHVPQPSSSPSSSSPSKPTAASRHPAPHSPMAASGEDYVDVDEHDVYVDPEELRPPGADASPTRMAPAAAAVVAGGKDPTLHVPGE